MSTNKQPPPPPAFLVTSSAAPIKVGLDKDLPSNVNSTEQLATLPPECLSNDPHRPLRHIDDRGNEYTYVLRPMQRIILLILIVETIERFSFYGVYYTQTLYLTGVYNKDWNAGFTSVEASSYVSLSTAVAYTTPFIGAILADTVLGDYAAIAVGSIFLYLPGLLLVALTTIPGLLGETFNHKALSTAVLLLWPLGTGIVKSVVNVFGAKQFHPLLQSSMIESYYVSFYTSINVGALVGISLLPILCQTHVTLAYMIPVGLLSFGVILFLAGSKHYVRSKPRGNFFTGKTRQSNGKTVPLTSILRISLLIVPFCVAYSQMPTTFIVQGTVMRKGFGFIDAATMNSLDAVSVLAFGSLTGTYIYPALANRNIKIPTTYKFAIGSALGALSILWALVVESMIHRTYSVHKNSISVFWQAPSYVLIGFGEIFAVSAAYEAAFSASSPQTKALASAINIFCVGGIPNVLCIALYHLCQGWFRNSRGDMNISDLEDYVSASVGNYFWVLVAVLMIGIFLNSLSPVRSFVESIEATAKDLVKTPQTRPLESTPLLQKRFGDQPYLYKSGSMRAGPSLSHTEAANIKVTKASYIARLYKKNNAPVAAAAGEQQQHSDHIHRHGSM
jgi:proton-dependent oligopeptide transporter, POT family